jgi:hypothetical protein
MLHFKFYDNSGALDEQSTSRHCSRLFTWVFIIPQSNKLRVPQVTIRCSFGELDLRDELRLEPNAILISSRVSENCVRFFSGRLAKGQLAISNGFSFCQTSRRTRRTKPFRTLAA